MKRTRMDRWIWGLMAILTLTVESALASTTNFQLFFIARSGSTSEVWHLSGSGTNFALVNKPASETNSSEVGLTYGTDNNLYVATLAPAVRRTTGFSQASATNQVISSNLTGPRWIDFSTNGNLYVADRNADSVTWFNANGNLISSFAYSGAFALDIAADNEMYVTSHLNHTGKVVRFDWSGAAWTPTWSITNLYYAGSVRRHGDYVYFGTFTAADTATSMVVKASATTGQVLSNWASPTVQDIVGMDFAPDGDLYIVGYSSTNLARCSMDSSGNITNTTVIRSAADGLSGPRGLVIVDQEMPLLIAEYKFNGTGSIAPSTGWETMSLAMYNSSDVATDLHGATGSGIRGGLGVSGSDTDRAFNNSAATGMGDLGTGGYARHPVDCDSMDAFSSFTVSGWLKTDEATPFSHKARIFNKYPGTVGWDVIGQGDTATPGTMQLAVNTQATNSVAPSWAATQTWVFFAAAYDGTKTSNNLKLYRGYRNAAESGGAGATVTLTDTLTLNMGRMNDATNVLYMGNAASKTRAFDGYLDNLRIHGTHGPNDARGALSLVELETIRHADVYTVTGTSITIR